MFSLMDIKIVRIIHDNTPVRSWSIGMIRTFKNRYIREIRCMNLYNLMPPLPQ